MKLQNKLPVKLSKPAQRALANAGITSLEQLSKYNEPEISLLHGLGQDAIKKIKAAFIEKGLSFAKNK
ncbi:MAG: hypothetical protein ABIQ31_04570 [Ferruginibacter sp.]